MGLITAVLYSYIMKTYRFSREFNFRRPDLSFIYSRVEIILKQQLPFADEAWHRHLGFWEFTGESCSGLDWWRRLAGAGVGWCFTWGSPVRDASWWINCVSIFIDESWTKVVGDTCNCLPTIFFVQTNINNKKNLGLMFYFQSNWPRIVDLSKLHFCRESNIIKIQFQDNSTSRL